MTLLTSLAAPLVPLAQGPLGPTLLVLVAAGLLTREIARASTPEGRLPAWTRAPSVALIPLGVALSVALAAHLAALVAG